LFLGFSTQPHTAFPYEQSRLGKIFQKIFRQKLFRKENRLVREEKSDEATVPHSITERKAARATTVCFPTLRKVLGKQCENHWQSRYGKSHRGYKSECPTARFQEQIFDRKTRAFLLCEKLRRLDSRRFF